MHPKQLIRKRFVSDVEGSVNLFILEMESSIKKNSLYNDAALLLSMFDIATSELTTDPSLLSETQDSMLFPDVPALSEHVQAFSKAVALTPRTQSLRELPTCNTKNSTTGPPTSLSLRTRSVSIDSPTLRCAPSPQTPKPLEYPPVLTTIIEASVVTPTLPKKVRLSHRNSHLSLTARHDNLGTTGKVKSLSTTGGRSVSLSKTKTLQGEVPKGTCLTKIHRRKFSWKNYPEVSIRSIHIHARILHRHPLHEILSFFFPSFFTYSSKHFLLPTAKNIFATVHSTTRSNKSNTTIVLRNAYSVSLRRMATFSIPRTLALLQSAIESVATIRVLSKAPKNVVFLWAMRPAKPASWMKTNCVKEQSKMLPSLCRRYRTRDIYFITYGGAKSIIHV